MTGGEDFHVELSPAVHELNLIRRRLGTFNDERLPLSELISQLVQRLDDLETESEHYRRHHS